MMYNLLRSCLIYLRLHVFPSSAKVQIILFLIIAPDLQNLIIEQGVVYMTPKTVHFLELYPSLYIYF